MPSIHPPIHVDDVVPENMNKGEGWAISEFRLPISGTQGSATTVFHSIFRPGSTHAKHLHARFDEIAVYLKGHGVVGQGDERTEVRPGALPPDAQRLRACLTTLVGPADEAIVMAGQAIRR